MTEIYSKPIITKELIDLHEASRQRFTQVFKNINQTYGWDENKDTRIVPLKLIIEGIQSKIILFELINGHFVDLKFWDNIKVQNEDIKISLINDRLYFIQEDLKGELFINVCMQLEHFTRMISDSIGLKVKRDQF